MNWLLITLFLNAQTGELDHYTATPMSLGDCVHVLEKTQLPRNVDKGVAQIFVCRQIDKDGNPVSEVKVDPNGKPLNEDGTDLEPEAPKVTI